MSGDSGQGIKTGMWALRGRGAGEMESRGLAGKAPALHARWWEAPAAHQQGPGDQGP